MGLSAWINPFNKVADIVSEVVTDKDEKNRLTHALEELKQQVYIQELGTKTIPWVDAIHKLGRQIISIVTVITPGVVLYLNPDIDINKLILMQGLSSGPGAIYNYIKGKGK